MGQGYLYFDNIIVYVENLKKFYQKNLLKLVKNYSKATTYNLIYKSQSSILDTRNKKWNLQFETIPFTLAPPDPHEMLRCKTKIYGHDVYENYKTLMKEIKENINEWKEVPCSWT